ncbi:hypothetical protein TrVE_jg2816 [Triparma verrucosa]|uniref:Amino acid transporter transmembrane domain-containing protein n=1 Tax=Triparma verrucosa TaxID=1606542 RepID=A0A9W7ERY5_9STRA|nr:hypothetical protein TrVE_jg2816 [Triparma verrucosa]
MLPLAFGLMSTPGSTGAISAAMILTAFAVLGWYGLGSMGRAKEIGGGDGDSLSSVHSSIGFKPSKLPTLMPLFLTLGCCLFYSAFLGDIFTPLLSLLLPSLSLTRTAVLITLAIVPLAPLCLLDDLSSLQVSSFAGLGGILYTICFVGYRAVTGGYKPGGEYYAQMLDLGESASHLLYSAPPSTPLFKVSKGTLTLMNMACVAFACHYNGVKYYVELKDRTVNKYSRIMGLGNVTVLMVFFCMMFFGASAFGGASQPLILNNFHPTADLGASFARGLVGCAIISGYPLMFTGLKSAVHDLLKIESSPKFTKDCISLAMLAAITGTATFVTEHELGPLLGVVGALFGSAVVYIIPAIWNLKVAEQMPFFKGERAANVLLGLGGCALAVLGTWVSLTEEGQHN